MKKTVGIIAGAITITTAISVGIKHLIEKPKKVKAKDPNEDFIKTYKAFEKECLKNTKNAEMAIKMTTELQKTLDEQYGVDPNEINVTIEDSLKVEAT